MNRLVVRLITSHVLVAVLGAAATFLIVRQLAPALFDESMRHQPQGPGWGQSQARILREQFAEQELGTRSRIHDASNERRIGRLDVGSDGYLLESLAFDRGPEVRGDREDGRVPPRPELEGKADVGVHVTSRAA